MTLMTCVLHIEYVFSSCNMSGLPDMSTRYLRAEGGHIGRPRVLVLQLLCNTFVGG